MTSPILPRRRRYSSDSPSIRGTVRTVLIAAAVGILAVSAPAAAQAPVGEPLYSRMSTAVGWTGVVPEALLGVAAVQMLGESGWGLYADAKITHDRKSTRSDFLENETVATVAAAYPEHLRGPDRDEWLFFNVGIVRELSSQLTFFGAGGWSRHQVTREYFDPSLPEDRLTPSGIYYVENDRDSTGWGITGMGGMLLRIGEPIMISTGFDWVSRSITLAGFWVVR